MHELSIALSMIDEIAEQSEARGGLSVEAVHLKLGVFSGVDKAALLFAWQLACEGTPLEGARLEIATIPLLIFCPSCKQERTPVSVYQLCCPDCLVPTPDIVTGREIEVASLEVTA
jgi:hydrogenase nickel incorporation protein HypA/HybF